MAQIKFLITVKDLTGTFAKYAVILSPNAAPNNLQSAVKFFAAMVYQEFSKHLTKDKKWIENVTEKQLEQKLKNIIWCSDFVELNDWSIDPNELSVKIAKEIWNLGLVKVFTETSEQNIAPADLWDTMMMDR